MLFVSFVVKMTQNRNILILGDIFAMAIVTVIGFATHRELSTSFAMRMSAAFFPLLIAWFLLAPWFGLFQHEITLNIKQIWRIAFVMLFAGPLAGVWRGFILHTNIVPIFVVVLGATSALGMIVWRAFYFLLNRKER